MRGIFWRKGIDWVVLNVPAVFHPPLIWFWTFCFFFFAAPARRTVHRQLAIILPGSSRLMNYFRTSRVFYNFGWSLTDGAMFRLRKAHFDYELSGETFLAEMAAADRAILLTAHMGNYDLGAGLFVEKFHRQIRMVRAPEPDQRAAQHVDLALEQASGGAVKVDYSARGATFAFDLLSALRGGDIISIQGDRTIPGVAFSKTKLFGHDVLLPTGPFVLSLAAEAPIYPLFIVRRGFRAYRIIAHEPIRCSKENPDREQAIAVALEKWAGVLEETVQHNWPQWFAFTPIFEPTAD